MELLIHPEELSACWIERARKNKISRISLHPRGGVAARESLEEMLLLLQRDSYRALIDELVDSGIEIGYEFHAASYLLPRELFTEHPEYFRMDENGERTPDSNFCFSSPDARKIVAERAAELAESLYRSPDEFYFWLDDSRKGACRCNECRKRSFADHQLDIMKLMVREIRKLRPNAKMCYLAYFEALAIPTGEVGEEIFLEYAPFDRYVGDLTLDGDNARTLSALIELFGRDTAKLLEYWYDNSLLSRWKKPPQPFTPDNEKIKAEKELYRDFGFERIASFACFLGEDYAALYGEPDLSATKP